MIPTQPDDQAVILTEGLTRTYKLGNQAVHAVRGASLRVHRGEFVALMGASGSGKSTLLHLLGCLDRPSAGAYYLDGRDVAGMGPDERARIRNRLIGFVFQNFNLLPRLRAWENTALPLLYRRGEAEVRQRAMQALQQVGLAQRAGHHPAELSGGERQRVAIARALITRPSLILADEPTGNLDSRTGAEILELLTNLNRRGITILMVTHDAQVAEYAGRTLLMQDGRIVAGEAERVAG